MVQVLQRQESNLIFYFSSAGILLQQKNFQCACGNAKIDCMAFLMFVEHTSSSYCVLLTVLPKQNAVQSPIHSVKQAGIIFTLLVTIQAARDPTLKVSPINKLKPKEATFSFDFSHCKALRTGIFSKVHKSQTTVHCFENMISALLHF